MLGKFSLNSTDRATDKHLLLVDDVITTGATLEAAGHTLLQIPEVRLSFFALAHTESTSS
jgi:predicted amidophosphoribosyltransferase